MDSKLATKKNILLMHSCFALSYLQNTTYNMNAVTNLSITVFASNTSRRCKYTLYLSSEDLHATKKS